MSPGYHSVGWALFWGILCIPGAGQWYNRQTAKGFTFLAVAIILGLQQYGFSSIHGYLDPNVRLVQLLLWVVLAVDAGVIAYRLNQGQAVHKWRFF